ncbi:hypothetical protein HDU76_013098 [Blyttiomyces sp. JEL0837]|nr:hypothetical protein HDU76_013098 [Blyttiomyces sp. JEL0837]
MYIQLAIFFGLIASTSALPQLIINAQSCGGPGDQGCNSGLQCIYDTPTAQHGFCRLVVGLNQPCHPKDPNHLGNVCPSGLFCDPNQSICLDHLPPNSPCNPNTPNACAGNQHCDPYSNTCQPGPAPGNGHGGNGGGHGGHQYCDSNNPTCPTQQICDTFQNYCIQAQYCNSQQPGCPSGQVCDTFQNYCVLQHQPHPTTTTHPTSTHHTSTAPPKTTTPPKQCHAPAGDTINKPCHLYNPNLDQCPGQTKCISINRLDNNEVCGTCRHVIPAGQVCNLNPGFGDAVCERYYLCTATGIGFNGPNPPRCLSPGSH